MNELVAMCVRCRSEFTDEQIRGAKACPSCGSTGVPADPRDKQTITLCAHEWRILFIWASNWAAQCDRRDTDSNAESVISAIEKEAKRQSAALPSLSMKEEIQDVANSFGKVDATIDGETTTFQPEKKH